MCLVDERRTSKGAEERLSLQLDLGLVDALITREQCKTPSRSHTKRLTKRTATTTAKRARSRVVSSNSS